jgi:hypothetical protein
MPPELPLSEWIIRLKPELNHLYYREPQSPGGSPASRGISSNADSDLGWFCREHALHVHCIAALLGHDSQVCQGDFVIQAVPRPQEPVQVISVGEVQSHAWCVIDGLQPVDVSQSVRRLAGGFTAVGNDIPAVIGPPPESAGFGLHYTTDLPDPEFRALCPPLEPATADKALPLICYNQKQLEKLDPVKLLADPYQLLRRPALGLQTFTQIHGSDVFFALTSHLLQVALGQVKGFAPYRPPDNALAAILKRHPRARADLEQRWQQVRDKR